MAKIRQPYDEPREVPSLGHQMVNPGQVIEIGNDRLASFLEAGWHPADAATRRTGERLYAEGVISVLAGADAARLAKLRDDQAPANGEGQDVTSDGTEG